jgi:hypothetical protein
MNFSEFHPHRPLDSLSAVTQITEGLLQNNFDYLLGTGNSFDHPAR